MPHFTFETLPICSSVHTAGNGKAKKHIKVREGKNGEKNQITVSIDLKVSS